MKQVLIFFSLIITLSVFSQTVTPRTGTLSSQDNTYRRLDYKQITAIDTAGLDSVKFVPKNFHTQIRIASVTDSITINPTSVALCYAGDELEVIVTNSSGSAQQEVPLELFI